GGARWLSHEVTPSRGGTAPRLFFRRKAAEDFPHRFMDERPALVHVEIHLDLRLADAAPDHLALGAQVEHQRALFDELERLRRGDKWWQRPGGGRRQEL